MTPIVRKLTQYVPLTREEFRSRFFERFYDPAFDDVRAELDKICERAWDGYIKYRKSPRTQPASTRRPTPDCAIQDRSNFRPAAGITLRAAGNARPCGRDRHQGR